MGKHRTTGDSIYWKLIRPVRLKEQRKIIIIFEHTAAGGRRESEKWKIKNEKPPMLLPRKPLAREAILAAQSAH